MFCRAIHKFDLIFYPANKAIPNKNGVLDVLNHMVRPMNTPGQARDYFYEIKSMVNCQNSQDKGPPECNSARGLAKVLFYNNTKSAFHTQSLIKRKFSNHSKLIYILERHLWVNNSKPLALAPTWLLACKQTDCITAGMAKLADPKLVLTPSKHNTFVWLYTMLDQRRRVWADVV